MGDVLTVLAAICPQAEAFATGLLGWKNGACAWALRPPPRCARTRRPVPGTDPATAAAMHDTLTAAGLSQLQLAAVFTADGTGLRDDLGALGWPSGTAGMLTGWLGSCVKPGPDKCPHLEVDLAHVGALFSAS
jgi:hypothetical protein